MKDLLLNLLRRIVTSIVVTALVSLLIVAAIEVFLLAGGVIKTIFVNGNMSIFSGKECIVIYKVIYIFVFFIAFLSCDKEASSVLLETAKKIWVKYDIPTVTVIAAVLLAFSTICVPVNTDLEKQQAEYENTIAEKDAKISELEQKNDSLKSFKEAAEVGKWQQKAKFLDEKIVLVTRTGKKYHKVTCQYVSDREFWAYNIEAAKSMGYTACSVCEPGYEEPTLFYNGDEL